MISGHYLQEIDENKCKIALINHVELNGSIQTIAINNLIHNDTIGIFKKLIKKLEGKYTNVIIMNDLYKSWNA